MKLTIGIVGNGFVGQATSLFETKETNLMIYDTESIKCRPTGCTLQEFVVCDIVFLCVPTPMERNGKCHTDIVENVVKQLKGIINQKKNTNCHSFNCSTRNFSKSELLFYARIFNRKKLEA